MNKLSKSAFNISQDIYDIAGEVEKLTNALNNFEINENVYANNLYIISCKIAYLSGIIDAMRKMGYKFSKYEKELTLLDSISETVNENFKISKVSGLTEKDMDVMKDLLIKYDDIAPFEDEDELDDDLNYNLSF